jgi:hypothetical protein
MLSMLIALRFRVRVEHKGFGGGLSLRKACCNVLGHLGVSRTGKAIIRKSTTQASIQFEEFTIEVT